MRENSKRFLASIVHKQSLLWMKRESGPHFLGWLGSIPIPLLGFHFFAAIGLLGALLTFRAASNYMLLYGIVIIHCATVSVFFFYNGPRVRLLLIPILAILGCAGLYRAYLWIQAQVPSKKRAQVLNGE